MATGIALGAVIRTVCAGLGSFGHCVEEGILLGLFDETNRHTQPNYQKN